jgi:hypothetical protein
VNKSSLERCVQKIVSWCGGRRVIGGASHVEVALRSMMARRQHTGELLRARNKSNCLLVRIVPLYFSGSTAEVGAYFIIDFSFELGLVASDSTAVAARRHRGTMVYVQIADMCSA